jgi:hypothetical protein
LSEGIKRITEEKKMEVQEKKRKEKCYDEALRRQPRTVRPPPPRLSHIASVMEGAEHVRFGSDCIMQAALAARF